MFTGLQYMRFNPDLGDLCHSQQPADYLGAGKKSRKLSCLPACKIIYIPDPVIPVLVAIFKVINIMGLYYSHLPESGFKIYGNLSLKATQSNSKDSSWNLKLPMWANQMKYFSYQAQQDKIIIFLHYG